jgi:dienelactone hydrolase
MRLLFVLPLVLPNGTAACDAKPSGNAPTEIGTTPPELRNAAEALTLTASDGLAVHGLLYEAPHPRAMILLFHQAQSSKGEYATIAPRLAKAGYSALAIDQRSGDEMFGPNETAQGLGRKADYLEAEPDLQAALDWAQARKLPIILWGSSYSSSLIFPLAARDPQGIVALLAFSPGEYFDDVRMIRSAAAKLRVPVFIASTGSADETNKADTVMAALPTGAANVRYVPEHGEHGSSTLIAARNREGAEANWRAVLAFLARITSPGG